MEYEGCKLISSLLWMERWGESLYSSDSMRSKLLAWLSVCVVVFMLIFFYVIVVVANDSTLAISQFLEFVMFDLGATVFALFILLTRPIKYALHGLEAQHDDDDNLQNGNSNENEDSPLLPPSSSTTADSPTPNGPTCPVRSKVDVTFLTRDPIMFINALLFLTCIGITTTYDVINASQHTTSSGTIVFAIVDWIENVVYATGFLLPAVAYRILALRIWRLRNVPYLLNLRGQSNADDVTAVSYQLKSLKRIRRDYEVTFEAAENLSERSSALTLLMISMAILEMVSVIKGKESGTLRSQTFSNFQLLRILLVLSMLLFQVILSSANLMFASELLAERLSQKECQLRELLLISRQIDESALPEYVRPIIQTQADLLKTLSYRVRNHPARISFGWFHLTTEWSMGISIGIASVVLGFIGIHLPSAE